MWTLLLTLAFAADADLDGLADEAELVLGTDPNHADSDLDGIPDGIEVGDSDQAPDFDLDGLIDALDNDDDDDTLPTSLEIGDYDPTILYSEPVNTDRQGRADYLDLDSDNDGDPDAVEGTDDQDCDGLPNWIDADDFSGDCDTGEPEAPETVETYPTPTSTDVTADPIRDTGDGGGTSGCGCRTDGTAMRWAWLLPGVLLMRRKGRI